MDDKKRSVRRVGIVIFTVGMLAALFLFPFDILDMTQPVELWSALRALGAWVIASASFMFGLIPFLTGSQISLKKM